MADAATGGGPSLLLGGAGLLFAVAVAALVREVRSWGPHGAAPAGWRDVDDADGVLDEMELDLTPKNAAGAAAGGPAGEPRKRRIVVRPLRWSQRLEAARLIATAHVGSAAYVWVTRPVAPPVEGAFEYSYTLAAQAAAGAPLVPAGASEAYYAASEPAADDPDPARRVRIRLMTEILYRGLSLLRSNSDLLAGCDAETGELVCYAQLVNPRAAEYSFASKLRVGLVTELPQILGLTVLKRLMAIEEPFDAMEDETMLERFGGDAAALARTDYLRLERVAVSPHLQGFGLGALLVRAAKRRMDAAGLGGFLHTQNERTAAMYHKHGWEYLNTEPRTFFEGPEEFPTWSMWRPPVDASGGAEKRKDA